MAIVIGKYEFDNKTQAESKINALEENHKHTIVKLGNIILEQGEYDSEGEETKAPVLSNKYHVDCAWKDIEETDEEGNITIDHPYGWKTYAINLEDEGVHGFMGIEYQSNKI